MARQAAGSDAEAYVTVLSTDSYLDGVLVLNASLRRSGSRYPLYVVVGSEVGPSARETLTRAGVQQIEAPALEIPDEIRMANLSSDYHRHWAGVFEKLLVFSLCQFRKIVYIDSDVLVLRNLDDLFSRPHMSGVVADIRPGNETCVDVNAGLMVIEPTPQLTDQLMATLPEVFDAEKQWRTAAGRPPSMGVQSVINAFWSDWIAHEELHLERRYNVLADNLDYYVRALGFRWRGPTGISVVHFIGEVKPWMRTKADLLRQLCRLVIRRRPWEAAATVAYLFVLSGARLRLRRGARPALSSATGR